MLPIEKGPYLTAVWRLLVIPALASPNFTVGPMVCLHYFLFSIIAGKGCFLVLGIVLFKAFHPLLCLTLPVLTEVDRSVDFL